ncbi:hypothetical protein X975_07962, partial [Stegodyphus mimosarum]
MNLGCFKWLRYVPVSAYQRKFLNTISIFYYDIHVNMESHQERNM